MNNIRTYNSGFTLLEMLFVVAIVVFVITGVLSAFMYGFILNRATTNLVVAANDAQYVLEKLKDTTYANIASYTDSNFTSLSNESIRVTVTTGTNEKDVVANVSWTEGERQVSYALTTKISW
jgi:prepilin-type N-terminal cleavage/methylation domain-containing protein